MSEEYLKNTACVYRHRRSDTNKVFYVGIGNITRAYSPNGRNKYWKNITNKTDYTIEILYKNLLYNEAIELEIFLIGLYGRVNIKTGILVNLTDGGEGNKGWNPSEITRDKMRKNNLGKKMSDVSKDKCRISGKKGSLKWAKKVKCTVTNKEWDSITDCAKEINIDIKLLSAYLNKKRINKTTIIFSENYE